MSTAPDPDQPTTRSGRTRDDGYPGLPAWVRWTLLAVLALVILLAIARLVGGGDHGPGRHGLSAHVAVAAAVSSMEVSGG